LSVPSDREIRTLHATHAPTREAFDLVYDHCRIVCELAEQVVAHQRLDVDVDLVRAGSLLHDIGVYRLYGASGELDTANYIRHGLLGQELLRELGLPEQVSRFCSHHTGVGVSRDDVVRQGLPIPVDDYLADSAEEELVMYADKFHSKSNPPRFLTAAEYAVKVRRFGADKEAAFAGMVLRYGEPELPDA
jgi:uncharacterized protein